MNSFEMKDWTRFLLENEVLEIHRLSNFPIRGVKTESPILINYQRMVQPKVAAPLAQAIALEINKWDHNGKTKTKLISGYDFSNVLAHRVAEILGVDFLPVKAGGYVNSPERFDQRTIHISDVLITGQNTNTALSAMWAAKHKCDGIITVFDFGFNLHSKNMRDTEIRPLVHMDDISNIPQIIRWKKGNENLFGSYGRWKKPAPAEWKEAGEVNSL